MPHCGRGSTAAPCFASHSRKIVLTRAPTPRNTLESFGDHVAGVALVGTQLCFEEGSIEKERISRPASGACVEIIDYAKALDCDWTASTGIPELEWANEATADEVDSGPILFSSNNVKLSWFKLDGYSAGVLLSAADSVVFKNNDVEIDAQSSGNIGSEPSSFSDFYTKIISDADLYSFALYSTYVGAKSSAQVVGNRFRAKPYEVMFSCVVGPILQPSDGSFNEIEHAMVLAGNVGTQFAIGSAGGGTTVQGVAYSEAELRALCEALAEKAPQAWIVSDDIYRKLTYNEAGHASVVRAAKGTGLEGQVVLVDGVSKSHAMTGYRIGFLAAPEPVAKAVSAVQGQTTSGASTPAQWAALAALTDPAAQAAVGEMQAKFAERRLAMIEGLRLAGAELVEPDGAFYVFPDFSEMCGEGKRFADDLALASFLLEDKGLATVPGSAFGAPGHLRLSFACSLADIREGTGLLAQALA